jgi:hypothetical protein
VERNLLSMLDAMVKSSNSNNHRERALGKLQFILPTMEEGYEERAPFQCLEPFMGLNTLRELYATPCLAIDDRYTGIAFQWRNSEVSSSLRRVELKSCIMDEEGISVLLSHTPLLEVFRYSHETKWHGRLHDWNAGVFVEALATYCGQSIIDLAITLDWMGGDIVNGVSSFRSFSKLRNLEIDSQILYGPPLGSGQEQGDAGGNLRDGEKPWTVDQIPSLEDMLPESIVDVQINTDFGNEDVTALTTLLAHFPEQREERLKDLAKVIIRQYCGNSARALVKRAGVKLSVFDHIDRNQVQRDMMPAWKRDFEWRVEELRGSQQTLPRN